MGELYHGDCLEVMKQIPDKSIDMILCDLPYGTTACKWDTIIPFEPLWEAYKRIIKDNGVIVLTASQPFSSLLVVSNIEWFGYEWVWDKVSGANFFNLTNRPFKVHEQVLVFFNNKNITFNPIRISRTEASLKRWPVGIGGTSQHKDYVEHYDCIQTGEVDRSKDGLKHPVNILTFNTQSKKRNTGFNHPTQKPVALFEYLIKTYTNEGELVLDNCAGSGTTAVACMRTGRDYILIEKDDQYFEIIQKRISEEEQKNALFIQEAE